MPIWLSPAGLIRAATALVLGVALAWPSSTEPPLAGWIGWTGVGCLVVALVGGWRGGVDAAAVLLVVRYGLSLAISGGTDPWVWVRVALLVLLIDMAHGAIESRLRAEVPTVTAARAIRLVLPATAASFLILVSVGLTPGGGILIVTAGVAAAVAALALLTLLLRRRT